MSREDITRYAREAGFEKVVAIGPHSTTTTIAPILELERFAALVRADERKAMMQLFTDQENQPTQHGTVTVEYMQREIEAEREACAKVAEKMLRFYTQAVTGVPNAIRARGKA